MLSDAELEALLDALAGDALAVVQPFAGRVVSIHVAVGDQVVDGALLVKVLQPSALHDEPEPVYAAGVNRAEAVQILAQPGDQVAAGQPLLWVRDAEPTMEVLRALLDEAIRRLEAQPATHWRDVALTLGAVRKAAQDGNTFDPGSRILRRPRGRPGKGQSLNATDAIRTAIGALTTAIDCPLPTRLRTWLVESLAGLDAALASGRPARRRALESFGRRAGAGRPRAEPSDARDHVALAAAVALLAAHEGKSQAVARIADAAVIDESSLWTTCAEVTIVDVDALPALAAPVMQRVVSRRDSPFGPIPAKLAELFPVT